MTKLADGSTEIHARGSAPLLAVISPLAALVAGALGEDGRGVLDHPLIDRPDVSQPAPAASPGHHDSVFRVGVVGALGEVITPDQTRGRPVLGDAAGWLLGAPVAEGRVDVVASAACARLLVRSRAPVG